MSASSPQAYSSALVADVESAYTTQQWTLRAQAAALDDLICELYGQGNSWMDSLSPERKRQAHRDLDRVLSLYRQVAAGAGLLDE